MAEKAKDDAPKQAAKSTAVSKKPAKTPEKAPKRHFEGLDTKSSRRKPGTPRKNPREQAEILERRILVYELVLSGVIGVPSDKKLTYRKISEHLKAKGFKNCSPATVCEDFHIVLAERKENVLGAAADDLLTMAVDMIYTMLPASVSRARKFGKPEDQRNVRDNLRELDRYLQFSKTQQSESALADKLKAFIGFDPEAPADGSEEDV